jgi:hypothetical protein
MLNDLLENKLNAGARHFVDMPEVVFFDELYEHAENLPGVEIIEFLMDGTLEMWLEFKFRGNKFFIGNNYGDYWFLVEDPECDEEILLEIAAHFRKLLER